MILETSSEKDIQSFLTEYKYLHPVFEAGWRELRNDTEFKRLQRSKKLNTRYMGVMNTRGWITFQTKSQFVRGRNYSQFIKLLDMKDIDSVKDLKKREIMRLMLAGDLAVHCTCPDFKYRKKYMAYQIGYGIYREDRFPKIRNPKLEGSVCKHLAVVLSAFMMNWTKIYRDMARTKYFQSRYDD